MDLAPLSSRDLTQATTEIRSVLEPPAKELVEAYFRPDGSFAASTFDALPPNEPNAIGVSDLLAVTFLDVAVKPKAVRQILGHDAHELADLLQAIPDTVPLWQASDDMLINANQLWERLRDYDGIDEVIAGKLLARKRPQLIPVVDGWTSQALPTASGRVWVTLRSVLQDSEVVDAIKGLRSEDCAPETSTLRLLDAATWMRWSEGKKARAVRQSLDLDIAPRKRR